MSGVLELIALGSTATYFSSKLYSNSREEHINEQWRIAQALYVKHIYKEFKKEDIPFRPGDFKNALFSSAGSKYQLPFKKPCDINFDKAKHLAKAHNFLVNRIYLFIKKYFVNRTQLSKMLANVGEFVGLANTDSIEPYLYVEWIMWLESLADITETEKVNEVRKRIELYYDFLKNIDIFRIPSTALPDAVQNTASNVSNVVVTSLSSEIVKCPIVEVAALLLNYLEIFLERHVFSVEGFSIMLKNIVSLCQKASEGYIILVFALLSEEIPGLEVCNYLRSLQYNTNIKKTDLITLFSSLTSSKHWNNESNERDFKFQEISNEHISVINTYIVSNLGYYEDSSNHVNKNLSSNSKGFNVQSIYIPGEKSLKSLPVFPLKGYYPWYYFADETFQRNILNMNICAIKVLQAADDLQYFSSILAKCTDLAVSGGDILLSWSFTAVLNPMLNDLFFAVQKLLTLESELRSQIRWVLRRIPLNEMQWSQLLLEEQDENMRALERLKIPPRWEKSSERCKKSGHVLGKECNFASRFHNLEDKELSIVINKLIESLETLRRLFAETTTKSLVRHADEKLKSITQVIGSLEYQSRSTMRPSLDYNQKFHELSNLHNNTKLPLALMNQSNVVAKQPYNPTCKLRPDSSNNIIINDDEDDRIRMMSNSDEIKDKNEKNQLDHRYDTLNNTLVSNLNKKELIKIGLNICNQNPSSKSDSKILKTEELVNNENHITKKLAQKVHCDNVFLELANNNFISYEHIKKLFIKCGLNEQNILKIENEFHLQPHKNITKLLFRGIYKAIVLSQNNSNWNIKELNTLITDELIKYHYQ